MFYTHCIGRRRAASFSRQFGPTSVPSRRQREDRLGSFISIAGLTHFHCCFVDADVEELFHIRPSSCSGSARCAEFKTAASATTSHGVASWRRLVQRGDSRKRVRLGSVRTHGVITVIIINERAWILNSAVMFCRPPPSITCHTTSRQNVSRFSRPEQ